MVVSILLAHRLMRVHNMSRLLCCHNALFKVLNVIGGLWGVDSREHKYCWVFEPHLDIRCRNEDSQSASVNFNVISMSSEVEKGGEGQFHNNLIMSFLCASLEQTSRVISLKNKYWTSNVCESSKWLAIIANFSKRCSAAHVVHRCWLSAQRLPTGRAWLLNMPRLFSDMLNMKFWPLSTWDINNQSQLPKVILYCTWMI